MTSWEHFQLAAINMNSPINSLKSTLNNYINSIQVIVIDNSNKNNISGITLLKISRNNCINQMETVVIDLIDSNQLAAITYRFPNNFI